MGFGAYLQEKYESATSSAKTAFDSMSQSVSDTGTYIADTAEYAANKAADGAAYAKKKAMDGAEYAADKAIEGATYVAGKAVDGAEYVADKAIEGAAYVKDKAEYAADKAIEGAAYVKDKAVDGAEYVADKAKEGAEYVSDKVVEAKEKVDKYLAPKPAGSKIIICSSISKKKRVELRQEKISKANKKLATMKPGAEKTVLENAATRFEFNNKAIERARLADNVYSIGQDTPPEGWKRVGLDEIKKLGLNPDDFPQYAPDFNPDDHTDGFFVDFYKTDPDVFGEEKYVLSYRGSQGKEDWKTNLAQSVGKETDHYTKAMSVAQDAQKMLGEKLEIAGHSLGGGMATAAGIVSGAKTYTFNTAGVHPATLERAGDFSREDAFNQINGVPLVDNVVIPDELLTGIQNPTFQRSIIVGAASSAPLPTAIGLSQDRAFREQGTLSYGMTGARHNIPLLGNAKEVADATAKGESIQGMTPSKMGEINRTINPLKKVDMHVMHSVIAGIEQQKADDINVIDQQVM